MPSEPGSLPASLTLAGRYRRDGRLADAEEICRGVLAAQPDSYEARHLLGVIAWQSGKIGEAIGRRPVRYGRAPTAGPGCMTPVVLSADSGGEPES